MRILSKPIVLFFLYAFILTQATRGDNESIGGSGDAYPYIIRPNIADTSPYDSTKDYFSITAVSWFVNQQGNWLKSKQASGTVQIKANSTVFNFPLGSFALAKGAKTAPIFNYPLLPTTPFDGSPITIQASITGMKQNTVLGGILQELATEAMSYATTSLGSLSLSTAYPGLSQLSTAANDISSTLVTKMGQNAVPIFDAQSGISITLGTEDLKGDVFYVLLYKGRRLNNVDLGIDSDNISVLEKGNRLSDGAWILFRVAKEETYAGARPWTVPSQQAIRQLKLQMTTYNDTYKTDHTAGETLSKALENTSQGTGKTLGDQFVFVINLIQSDNALSSAQSLQEAIRVNAYLDWAKAAIAQSNPRVFFDNVAAIEGATPAPATVASATKAIQNLAMKTQQANSDKYGKITISDELASKTVNLSQVKMQKLQDLAVLRVQALDARKAISTLNAR